MTDVSAPHFYREPPRGGAAVWLVAALVVVGLHVGIALFLLHRQPETPPSPASDAVLLELPAPELHAAPQAEKAQEETSQNTEEKPPEEVKPPEPTPPDPTPPPPEPTPPAPPEPPPPEAVLPTPPVPEMPVLPKVEAPIEQPKPDPAAEAAKLEEQKRIEAEKQVEIVREQELKRQEIRRQQEVKRQKDLDAKREAKRQQQIEAKKKAEAGRRDKERREAASREKAEKAGRDQRNSQARAASGPQLAAWSSSVHARVLASAQAFSNETAGASSVSFFVTPSGAITRVSGSGAAASAVRSVGSVSPPPDGAGHPMTVTVRFR